MATALDLLENLKKVNLKEIAKSSLINTMPQLLRSQKKQMMKGQKADGSVMNHYSKVSQTVFGKPDIPMTLRDTGSFQENLYLEVGSDSYEIGSTDEKSSLLTKKYTSEIFGLNEENKDNYTEQVLIPEIQAEITAITGLKFQ